MKILVVEDEPMLRDGLRDLLTGAGHEVEVAGDLAFSRVNVIISSSPKEGGPTAHLDLKVLDIYKRQTDGSWKIYIDCLNANPKWSNDSISPEMLDKQDTSDPVL